MVRNARGRIHNESSYKTKEKVTFGCAAMEEISLQSQDCLAFQIFPDPCDALYGPLARPGKERLPSIVVEPTDVSEVESGELRWPPSEVDKNGEEYEDKEHEKHENGNETEEEENGQGGKKENLMENKETEEEEKENKDTFEKENDEESHDENSTEDEVEQENDEAKEANEEEFCLSEMVPCPSPKEPEHPADEGL
uniref:LBH domain-containing protein n=1 Tax=Eptatretus burgeri TaxID=7764 RepID=A0A8C4QNP0_EPTBU